MRRFLTVLASGTALAGLWLLIVGTKALLEVYAGLIAAAIAAVALEAVRRQGLLRFRPELRWVARAAAIPAWAVFDFGVVMLALARSLTRRRLVEGTFLAVPFPAGDERARYAFRRALATAAGTINPNAIVVDIDRERSLALLHTIDTRRKTGRQAL